MFLLTRGFAIGFSLLYVVAAALVLVSAFALLSDVLAEAGGAQAALGIAGVVVAAIVLFTGMFHAMWWTCSAVTDVPFEPLRPEPSTARPARYVGRVVFGLLPVAGVVYALFLRGIPDAAIERFWHEVPVARLTSTLIRYPLGTSSFEISALGREFDVGESLARSFKTHVSMLLVVLWSALTLLAYLTPVKDRLRVFAQLSLYATFAKRFGPYAAMLTALLWGTILCLLGLWPGLLLLLSAAILANDRVYQHRRRNAELDEATQALEEHEYRRRREDELQTILHGRDAVVGRRRRAPVTIPNRGTP